ncbi:MAG: hemolysin family protein [bacterium]|nr:hemolysin family protein [bacterium]
MWTLEIIVILSMIAMNGIFAGYEISLAAVSLARLRILEQEKKHGARSAVYMKENISASLAVIQLGITLFGAIAAATGGAGAKESLAPFLKNSFGLSYGLSEIFAISIVVLPLTIISIIFGELIPKIFALKNPEAFCLKLSPVIKSFALILKPLVMLFESTVTGIVNWIQENLRPMGKESAYSEPAELKELHAAVYMARSSHVIGRREEDIIKNTVRLSHYSVQGIMLQAAYINMLNVDDALEDCLIAAHLYLHTRFPVTERKGDPQAIIGYVNFKDIVILMRLSPDRMSLRSILHPVPSIPTDMSVAAALEMMIKNHTHIALIRDNSMSVAGMITLEDVMEELVGEIRDEHDRLPIYIVPVGESWVVGGGVSLSLLKETAGIDLSAFSEGQTAPTLTGLITNRLGRPPRGGDILEYGNLRVVIRKIRHEKVLEAQLTLKT